MIEISRSHIEAALRYIALSCGGTSFTDFVMICRVNTRRLSDHLLLDLKHDNTLPENFESLDQFRMVPENGGCLHRSNEADEASLAEISILAGEEGGAS
jgi:hypothetical protein